MNDQDIRIRNLTYGLFVRLGRAPTPGEVAGELGRSRVEILEAWRRLHDGHALVLERTGDAIRMANPFSAVPTAYRVHSDGRWWYANCAWDAFGICAALGDDGRIECSCPDCGEALQIELRDEAPDDESLVFHTLVPARRWWDDIVYT